jgi:hypothetical protein
MRITMPKNRESSGTLNTSCRFSVPWRVYAERDELPKL